MLELREGARIEPQPLPDGYAVRQYPPGEERTAYRSSRTPSTSGRTAQPSTYDDWAAGSCGGRGSSRGTCGWSCDPGGEVVGVGFVFLSGDCGYVQTLAVRRDQRGRGLARALLADCFEVAREHGASRSELSTDSRTGALGLYERVGMTSRRPGSTGSR